MTAHQVGAIGAAIISTGKEAEVAATGFNALAVKLASPNLVHDKDFAKGLRAIRLGVRQLKAEMAQNPEKGFLDVLDRINKLPQGKKLETAVRIGGLEYGDDLVAAASAVDQIRAALAKMQDQAARSGSVEKTFAIFNATTQRSIDKMSASFESFAARLGQRFTPLVKGAADALAGLFDRLTEGIERSDKVDEIGRRLAEGGKLTPDEKKKVDADPDMKARIDREQAFQGRFNWMLPRQDAAPAPTPKSGAADAFQERFNWMLPRKDANPAPGLGKRSDLADHARASFAAYNEEVERGLDRTQRIVHKASLLIRADLDVAGRFGDGTPRLINASWDGEDGGSSAGGGGFGTHWNRMHPRGGGGGGGAPAPIGPANDRGSDAGLGRGRRGFAGRARPGGPGFGAGAQYGAGGGAGSLTALTEAEARRAGIDPRIMHGIRAGESAHGGRYDIGDGGSSFGPWQLHYGGINPRMPRAGLGEEFDKFVGRHHAAMDPSTIPAQTRFVAQWLRNHSPRGVWFGYRGNRDANPRWGNSGYVPAAGAPTGLGGGRKGFANLMHGQYGPAGSNLTKISTPSGRPVTVHAAAAESFRGFLKDLEGSGYKIDSIGGYNYRAKRGGAGLSQHAYGNAIDINPARNPFHSNRTDMPANVSEMAAKWGLSWGGDWSPRSRDPMHFEWTGARPWEGKQGPRPTAANTPRRMPFGLRGLDVEELDRRHAMSPRHADPKTMTLKPNLAAPSGGPPSAASHGGHNHVTQHFHGGFDAATVARRAMLEQNRAIRRAMAGALHDIGRVG